MAAGSPRFRVRCCRGLTVLTAPHGPARAHADALSPAPPAGGTAGQPGLRDAARRCPPPSPGPGRVRAAPAPAALLPARVLLHAHGRRPQVGLSVGRDPAAWGGSQGGAGRAGSPQSKRGSPLAAVRRVTGHWSRGRRRTFPPAPMGDPGVAGPTVAAALCSHEMPLTQHVRYDYRWGVFIPDGAIESMDNVAIFPEGRN